MSVVNGKMFLSQSEWVRLPQDQRDKLREVFGVAKSGHAKVASMGGGHDVLQSDGTEPHDLLSSLHIEKILAWLGHTFEPKSNYDYDKLFQAVLGKLFPEQYNHSQTNVPPPKVSTAQGLADFPKTDTVHPSHITKVGETDKPKVARKPKGRSKKTS